MKKKIFIILYSLLIIFEIMGFIYSVKEISLNLFLYYTELSNILLLISSIFELHFLINKKDKKNNLIDKYGYTSVLSTTITFLVVLFILGPSMNFNYKYLLIEGSMLFHHLLCPILGLILFLFNKYKPNKKDIIYSMSFTFIYAIIFITLNIFKIVEGPYFFLMVYKQSVFMSLLWFIVVLGFSNLISRIIYKLKIKVLTK